MQEAVNKYVFEVLAGGIVLNWTISVKSWIIQVMLFRKLNGICIEKYLH